MICSICLTNISEKSYICTNILQNNIHYNNICYSNIHITTPCNHKFHKCCILSYLWIKTGCDIKGESGSIDCPYCKTKFTITI